MKNWCPSLLVLVPNFYTHTWQVSGNGVTQNLAGDHVTIANLPPGFYTVTCTRSYSGGLAGPSSSYSRTLSVASASSANCCPNPPCHEARLLPDDTAPEAADIKFAAWPNPTQGKLSISFATESDGIVKIALTPLNQTNGAEVILTESGRPAGNYIETYYVNHLPNGMYLLSVTEGGKVSSKKIVVSN